MPSFLKEIVINLYQILSILAGCTIVGNSGVKVVKYFCYIHKDGTIICLSVVILQNGEPKKRLSGGER